MAVESINIDQARIKHTTKVDFMNNLIMKPIRVVQYDNNLPIVEAELFMDGEPYTLPQNAEVRIRWGKKDHTFIIKEIMGCDESRRKIYFEVDNQMTYFSGPANPILELKIDDRTAGSSYIYFNVDRNPVQDSDIKSEVEYTDLGEYVELAQEAAQGAHLSATAASAAADRAAGYESAVEAAATQALSDIDTAKTGALTDISNAKDTAVSEALSDISDAKDSAVSDVGTAKTGALTDISSAKDTAVTDIGTAKTGALNDISAAEETAIENIEAAEAEAIAHIDDHKWAEVGSTGQTTPSANLAVGGIFYEKIDE